MTSSIGGEVEVSLFFKRYKVNPKGLIVRKAHDSEYYIEKESRDTIIHHPEKPYGATFYFFRDIDKRKKIRLDENVVVFKGIPIETYERTITQWNGKEVDTLLQKTVEYCNNAIHGNMRIVKEEDRTILYSTKFKKGSGYWKDFFYTGSLKEEGQVKKNFKYGKWTYYNKKGEIDSTKTYTLKDSIDVRFPHCIFNKKELCY
ncbi:hypothetical protein KN811_20170 [Sinomicrobium sp. 2019215]|nr:hypothetical protein [Sinomicrobium weinanense]MBU3125738.1 hypothetical protein [Sinomicrobium weinanense]